MGGGSGNCDFQNWSFFFQKLSGGVFQSRIKECEFFLPLLFKLNILFTWKGSLTIWFSKKIREYRENGFWNVQQRNRPQKHSGQSVTGVLCPVQGWTLRGLGFCGVFFVCFCHKIFSVFQGGSEDCMMLSDILRKSVYNSKWRQLYICDIVKQKTFLVFIKIKTRDFILSVSVI